MNKKITIIGIIICIIIFITLAIILSQQNLKNIFAAEKEINNIVEFNQCNEGDFVKVKVTKAYETEYYYQENGQDVARYIDIELNGYALIAVVENTMAEKIINNEEGTIYLQGRLEKLENTEMAETLNKIKNNYLEDLGMEMEQEDILNMFTSLQLINYGEEKPNSFLVISLVISLIGTVVVLAILLKRTIKK